ncbi:hypothetical protein [Caproicibacter sp. BJN0012]|uniref:hypothetical protein n=1 Tax=Caproicibacter sp. BJN0012 TaxID=3110227 RepID=UPI0026A96709
MYYSEISKSTVTEEEALMQIVHLCSKWFQYSHPKGDLSNYLMKHSDIFLIERWPDFKKID